MDAALYLIPVTLGETEISQVLPPYNHDIIVGIKHFIVENIRSARRFLKKTEKSIDIPSLFTSSTATPSASLSANIWSRLKRTSRLA